MTTLLGPILAAALVAQIHGLELQGKVVDDQAKPVAAHQVVIHIPVPWSGKSEPLEVRATTDTEGTFRFIMPSPRRVNHLRALIWAFHPALAITVVARLGELPRLLALRKSAVKTITIEGPDGRPIAGRGYRRSRLPSVARGTIDVPDSLGASWAVVTGPDGKATVDFLAGADQLVAGVGDVRQPSAGRTLP